MGPVQEGTLPFVARGRHLLSYRHFHTERWYIRAISQGNDKQASLFCFFSLLSHREGYEPSTLFRTYITLADLANRLVIKVLSPSIEVILLSSSLLNVQDA